MKNFAEFFAAELQRELAAFDAQRRTPDSSPGAAAATPAGARTSRRGSPVLSVRLGEDELAALNRCAAVTGMPPSTLARNLIRVGLQARRSPDQCRCTQLNAVVEQAEAAIAQLRMALS